jgi:hypothetical protein
MLWSGYKKREWRVGGGGNRGGNRGLSEREVGRRERKKEGERRDGEKQEYVCKAQKYNTRSKISSKKNHKKWFSQQAHINQRCGPYAAF